MCWAPFKLANKKKQHQNVPVWATWVIMSLSFCLVSEAFW